LKTLIEDVRDLSGVEAGQQHFALVHRGVILPVAVHVGVDDQIRRLRDHHLIAEDRDTER